MNNKKLGFKSKVKKNALVFMMATTVVGGVGVSNIVKAEYSGNGSQYNRTDYRYDFDKDSVVIKGESIDILNGKLRLKNPEKQEYKDYVDNFNRKIEERIKYLQDTGRDEIRRKLRYARNSEDVLEIFKNGMEGHIDADTKQLIEDVITNKNNPNFYANVQTIIDKISIEQGDLTWDKLEDTPSPMR